MNLRKHLVVTLTLAALAVGFAASPARADEVLKGSFNLPTEAYWGATLLQPGDYTFAVDSDSTRASIVYLQGEGMRTAIIAGPVMAETIARGSHLILSEVNGNYFVHELAAAPLGKAFEFAPSKAAKNQTQRASDMMPITVAVVTSSGF